MAYISQLVYVCGGCELCAQALFPPSFSHYSTFPFPKKEPPSSSCSHSTHLLRLVSGSAQTTTTTTIRIIPENVIAILACYPSIEICFNIRQMLAHEFCCALFRPRGVSCVCVCVLSCSPHANKYIIILRAILQSRRLLPSCS